LQIQHDAIYVDDLLQRIKDLETLYAIVTGPEGDGGKFNYLMQQLEKRFCNSLLTKRTREVIDRILEEVDGQTADSLELNRTKKQILNIFTGGKLFPGDQNDNG
jgi:arginine utilization protein RocB